MLFKKRGNENYLSFFHRTRKSYDCNIQRDKDIKRKGKEAMVVVAAAVGGKEKGSILMLMKQSEGRWKIAPSTHIL